MLQHRETFRFYKIPMTSPSAGTPTSFPPVRGNESVLPFCLRTIDIGMEDLESMAKEELLHEVLKAQIIDAMLKTQSERGRQSELYDSRNKNILRTTGYPLLIYQSSLSQKCQKTWLATILAD